jgi:hypothetical protein
MEEHMALRLASQVSRDDGNYMKCHYRDHDTSNDCKIAHEGAHNYFSNSLFCPETHPTIICEAARFYLSKDDARETNAAFMGSGENPDSALGEFKTRYRWTTQTLMKSSWESYLRYHNKLLMDVTPFGTLDTSSSGFQLPTW